MMQSSMTSRSTSVDTSSRPAAPSDEVEFLYEAYKGADLVVLDEDHDCDSEKDKALSQTSVSSFRFLDLPAELRHHVYSFVLPTDMNIRFENVATRNDKQPDFVPFCLDPHGQRTFTIGRKKYRGARRNNHIAVETQLFRVSKLVSNEAQSVLYGTNTYTFIVHGQALWPNSLRSPYIFGAFGHPHRLPLLRNLRRIHIDVTPDVNSHWAVKRQRDRLQYFVEILKEHADDDNQKSLLQDLTVTYRLRRVLMFDQITGHGLRPGLDNAEKFMFGLESLAALRSIKHVHVTGLPEWYARCLQLCIQGKGGNVQETDWPLIQVKRRTSRLSRSKKAHWTTLRKWYQPMLNWVEFAERNDIPVPDDISKFWEAE